MSKIYTSNKPSLVKIRYFNTSIKIKSQKFAPKQITCFQAVHINIKLIKDMQQPLEQTINSLRYKIMYTNVNSYKFNLHLQQS